MKPTGLSSMLRRVSVVATATLGVLGVHTAAFAQQSPAPDAEPAAAAEAAPQAVPTPPPPPAAQA
ncbi:MAG: tonB-system energizer ExbB, partial [Polyangia bacterium]